MPIHPFSEKKLERQLLKPWTMPGVDISQGFHELIQRKRGIHITTVLVIISVRSLNTSIGG